VSESDFYRIFYPTPTPEIRLNDFVQRTTRLPVLTRACWNATISFETFIETDNSFCAPRFPLIACCSNFSKLSDCRVKTQAYFSLLVTVLPVSNFLCFSTAKRDHLVLCQEWKRGFYLQYQVNVCAIYVWWAFTVIKSAKASKDLLKVTNCKTVGEPEIWVASFLSFGRGIWHAAI